MFRACELGPTISFLCNDREWITSNNLNEARHALTNMIRTVAVVPFSYLTATNKMLHAISLYKYSHESR